MLRLIGGAFCFAAGFVLTTRGVVYSLPLFAIGFLFLASSNKIRISSPKVEEYERVITLAETNRLLESEIGALRRINTERETTIKDLQNMIMMYKERVKKLNSEKNLERVPIDNVEDLMIGWTKAKEIARGKT